MVRRGVVFLGDASPGQLLTQGPEALSPPFKVLKQKLAHEALC